MFKIQCISKLHIANNKCPIQRSDVEPLTEEACYLNTISIYLLIKDNQNSLVNILLVKHYSILVNLMLLH